MCAALEVGNKQGISVALRQYKTPSGALDYPSILSIPQENRITKMAENDFKGTLMVIVAGLTLAMESMNLKRGLNATQIVDLSEAIIDSASEDYLALEDLMLFLQKLVRGEYGVNYESMDIPKFMDKFEVYREERHQQLYKIREEKHASHKVSGDTSRSSKSNELAEHFSGMASRISELNSKLREQRQENKELRDE